MNLLLAEWTKLRSVPRWLASFLLAIPILKEHGLGPPRSSSCR
jgi:hypothetical protein